MTTQPPGFDKLTSYIHGELSAEECRLIEEQLLSDRDLLHKDLACFLYADPMAPKRAHAIPVNANFPASALLDHPILTISSGVLLGLASFRVIELIAVRLFAVLF